MAVVIPYVKQTHIITGSWTAAKANVVEDGTNDAHYMPTVKAIRTAVQTITTATWTLVSWTGTDAWDTAGNAASTMHDPGTNPARLIARHAGKFQFSWVCQFGSGTTGIRVGQVQKNSEALPAAANTGVAQGGFAQSAPSAAVSMYLSATGAVDLAVNDYLACVVHHTQGSNVDLGVDSYFTMTRIG